jgi:hypothetical protein
VDVGAKLAIIVDAQGARHEIALTSEELRDLANRGTGATDAMKKLGDSLGANGGPGPIPPALPPRINLLAAQMERMKRASAQRMDLGLAGQIEKLDPFQLRVDQTAQSLGRLEKVARGGLSLGRLGNQFAGLAGQIGGVHPVVGNILGVMGNFAIGSPWTVGIMAGIAAIAVVWDQVTKSEREAKKATDELKKSLEESNFKESLGPAPDLRLQTDAFRNTLMQQRERKRQLTAFGVRPDDQRIIDLNVQIAHSQTELEAGEKRLFKARMDAGTPLKTVVTDARNIKEENRKAAQFMKEYEASILQANKASTDLALAQAKGTLSVQQQKDDALALLDGIIRGKAAYDAVNDAIEVRNALEAAGINIFDARYDAAKRDLEIAQRARHETETRVDAEKKAGDEAIAAQKKAADAAERITENFVRSMQENFSKFFVDTFNQGFSSFQKLFASVRDLYLKMIADILAAKLMDKIGGAFGIGSPSTVMNAAATKQIAAGATMLAAANTMLIAANVAATGQPMGMGSVGTDIRGASGGTPTGGPRAGGIGWARGIGSAAAGGLIGYQIGSMTTNRTQGALGGAAGGALAGFAVGGPVGAAIGGIAGFVGGIIGSGKAAREAARQMKSLQDHLKLTMDQFRAQIRGDELAIALAQARAGLIDLLKSINEAYSGKKNEAERNRLRAEATALEAQQEAQIRANYEAQQKADQDKLRVRLLTAQGKDAEAAELQRQMERDAMIQSFGAEIDSTEAATLALLDQVLAQEKLTDATDAANKSALNMVSGYKLQATVFGAMAPGGSAAAAGRSPSNPTPLGGQGTTIDGDLHVDVIVDGAIIGKAVLKNFKSKAQKKFGDSSRWPEIQS